MDKAWIDQNVQRKKKHKFLIHKPLTYSRKKAYHIDINC